MHFKWNVLFLSIICSQILQEDKLKNSKTELVWFNFSDESKNLNYKQINPSTKKKQTLKYSFTFVSHVEFPKCSNVQMLRWVWEKTTKKKVASTQNLQIEILNEKNCKKMIFILENSYENKSQP